MRESRKLLLAVGIGLALVTLFYAPRAIKEHGLAAYERRLRAQGEKLDIAELIPVALPGSNGAFRLISAANQLPSLWDHAPPVMRMIAPNRALVAWNQPTLLSEKASNLWPMLEHDLAVNGPRLAQICDALTNPIVQVDLPYNQGAACLLPHLAEFKGAALDLSATTILLLHQRQPDQAWIPLLALARFPKVWRGEPFLICQLVRAAITAIAVETVWEALEYPGWSDRQLAELQKVWQSFSLTDALAPSLAMERAVGRQAVSRARDSRTEFDKLTSTGGGSPGIRLTLDSFLQNLVEDPANALAAPVFYRLWKWSWSYQEQRWYDQVCQCAVQDARRVSAGASFRQLRQWTATEKSTLDHECPRRPFYVLPRAFSQRDPENMFLGYFRKILRVETERQMVVAAIALERYRRQHGAWPATLDQLVPEFLPTVPRDCMDGRPLRYRLRPDGTFLLYSIGDNGQDDGGDPTPTQPMATPTWINGRDWVWPQPATPEQVAASQARARARRAAARPRPR
ncbi:MAG: hypothetical protein KGS61_02895 [Verrucomicrobia bacterium]|nr:hypothetical protein [Verrucomicrobiota bacterium]